MIFFLFFIYSISIYNILIIIYIQYLISIHVRRYKKASNQSNLFIYAQCVNRLSVDTRKIVRGHHTRRTSAFVRACAAFCFITIPSLTLVHTRLQLYLLSGQVALLNQCLGQGKTKIDKSSCYNYVCFDVHILHV